MLSCHDRVPRVSQLFVQRWVRVVISDRTCDICIILLDEVFNFKVIVPIYTAVVFLISSITRVNFVDKLLRGGVFNATITSAWAHYTTLVLIWFI